MDDFDSLANLLTLRRNYEQLSLHCAQNILSSDDINRVGSRVPHKIIIMRRDPKGRTAAETAALFISGIASTGLLAYGAKVVYDRIQQGQSYSEALGWQGKQKVQKVRADLVPEPKAGVEKASVKSNLSPVQKTGNIYEMLMNNMLNNRDMQLNWLKAVKISFQNKRDRLDKTRDEVYQQGSKVLRLAATYAKHQTKITDTNLEKAEQHAKDEIIKKYSLRVADDHDFSSGLHANEYELETAKKFFELSKQEEGSLTKQKDGEVNDLADQLFVISSMDEALKYIDEELIKLNEEIRVFTTTDENERKEMQETMDERIKKEKVKIFKKAMANGEEGKYTTTEDVPDDDLDVSVLGFLKSFQNTLKRFGRKYLKDKWGRNQENKDGYAQTSSHTEVWNELAANILLFIKEPKAETFTGKTFALAFMGPPGTGKSYTSERWAELLISARIVPKQRKPTMVTADAFISQYRNGSRSKTRRLLYTNILSLLILDEAYSIAKPNGQDGFDSYSEEAVDTLIGFMTERQTSGLLTFFALGYVKEMQQQFFKINAGMASRFSIVVQLDNISPSVLWQILVQKAPGLDFSKRARNFILTILPNDHVFPGFVRDIGNFIYKLKVLFLHHQVTRIGIREVWKALKDFMDANITHAYHTEKLPYSEPPYEMFELQDAFRSYQKTEVAEMRVHCTGKDRATTLTDVQINQEWTVMDRSTKVNQIFWNEHYDSTFIILFSYRDDVPVQIDNGKYFAYLIPYYLTEQPEVPGCYLYQEINGKLTRHKVDIDPDKKSITEVKE